MGRWAITLCAATVVFGGCVLPTDYDRFAVPDGARPDAGPRCSTEVCNGLDDDCDGEVDDNLGTQTCGVGACARVVPACVNGVPSCDPGNPGAEACNTMDDDCDMRIDEQVPDQTCGMGPCARTAPGCGVGGVIPACTPGPSSPEQCPPNSVDDNCDGSVDNVDCSHNVTCRVYGALGVPLSAPADAIAVDMPDHACTPDGTCGTYVQCQTTAAGDGHVHNVWFSVFSAGYMEQAGPYDYLHWNSSCLACFPDDTCRGFFGLAVTTNVQGHTHPVVCQIFDDDYANPIDNLDAITWNCSASSLKFFPGGGSASMERKWWGRCRTL